MGLNRSIGNMYPWITDTWNTIKGTCPHNCTYCYMKRFKNQKPIRFDAKELKTDLGEGNFIFTGSSCDMFAEDINPDWVMWTLDHCEKFRNRYLFQSKNPIAFEAWPLPPHSVICTTIETNRWYPKIMCDSPKPIHRANAMSGLIKFPKYVTIEPIMDFDLTEMVDIIEGCMPLQVNIGADSGGNKLPEPSKDKILALITQLGKFTPVVQKSNLKRLLK